MQRVQQIAAVIASFLVVVIVAASGCTDNVPEISHEGAAGSVAVKIEHLNNGNYTTLHATRADGTHPNDTIARDDTDTLRVLTNAYSGTYTNCQQRTDGVVGAICTGGAVMATFDCHAVSESGYTRRCSWSVGFGSPGDVWTKASGSSWVGLASITATGQFGPMNGSAHSITWSGP